jgi:uncharacterized membrane protein
MTTCAFTWLAVFLLFPVLLVWNLTESKSIKIRRARSNGHTWKAIANRYSISPTTARRWANA